MGSSGEMGHKVVLIYILNMRCADLGWGSNAAVLHIHPQTVGS